ncbi:MAG: helix-turn-helix domain-containing protein [Bacillota bacterium]
MTYDLSGGASLGSEFIDTAQAAQMLGLSAYTVRAYARRGILPAHRIGREWRFSRSDLENWVRSGYRPDFRDNSLPTESGQQYSAGGILLARDVQIGPRESVRRSPEREVTEASGSAGRDMKDPLGFRDRNRRSVDTLLRIRARAGVGRTRDIVIESRSELLERADRRGRP